MRIATNSDTELIKLSTVDQLSWVRSQANSPQYVKLGVDFISAAKPPRASLKIRTNVFASTTIAAMRSASGL